VTPLKRLCRAATLTPGHKALIEEIEDLRDRLSVHERENLTVDLDKLKAGLGVH
jgi:hypothetical protein